jgi:hypothetical protein
VLHCLIPQSQLVNGGPGRDGIPALNRPAAVAAAAGDRFLRPDSLVVGVAVGAEARAYPHNVLWWHEIVNDELGGRPIVVSYCPLTGSGLVYDAVIGGRTLTFGVSGLLFDNNLVLFDRATDSLWSQMRVQSVCGTLSSTTPTLLPVVQSTWAAWKALHPATTVVSFDTGFARNYNQYPYGNYDQLGDNSLLFPQSFVDPRRPPKELVIGIREGTVARAALRGAWRPGRRERHRRRPRGPRGLRSRRPDGACVRPGRLGTAADVRGGRGHAVPIPRPGP